MVMGTATLDFNFVPLSSRPGARVSNPQQRGRESGARKFQRLRLANIAAG
jgi:hypothetical protein